MKLYATVTSDRNVRPARKGGDAELRIELSDKIGLIIATMSFFEDQGVYHLTLDGASADMEFHQFPKIQVET